MIQFQIGNVFSVARSDNPQELDAVSEALSYIVPDLEFIRRRNRRLRHWDGKKSFFDKRNACFLTGFLWSLPPILRAQGINAEYHDRRVRPDVMPDIDWKSVLKGIELRDYQIRTDEDFMKRGRGVAQLPTGAGKTEVAMSLIQGTGLNTLFLTHRAHLLHQTSQRFLKRMPNMKSDIGVIGDSIYHPNRVTVATVQTLDAVFRAKDDLDELRKSKLKAAELERELALLKKKGPKSKLSQIDREKYTRFERLIRVDQTSEMIEARFRELVIFLEEMRFLIIDEAHRSGAKQFHRPALYCKNAYYRLALTATPFMKGNAHDDMMLMGVSGPVVSRVSYSELIQRGVLARPFFKFFEITEPRGLQEYSFKIAYANGIVHNAYRNGVIATQASKLSRGNMAKKVLVIVVEREHGKLLEKLMLSQGTRAQYLDGANTQAEREKALKLLGKDKLDVVIATNIFDEGVDVEDIGAVILAGGTKSAPALFQRSGRAMRKKEGGNTCIIVDFVDRQHHKLLEHSERRYALVKSEPGFTIL
jgi:superfamily II DNA or RNA helicase